MASDFRLQITDAKGEVVNSWLPGNKIETDIIEDLCKRTQAKGIGLGRTEAHVLDDIRAAFRELLFDLKRQVR